MNAEIDFIVHPMFFIYSPIKSEKEKYWDSLREVVNKSKRSVILNTPIPNLVNADYQELKRIGEYTQRLAEEKNIDVLYTNSIEDPVTTNSYGHVFGTEFMKLNAILNEVDNSSKIRIHGAYHDQCTQNLAIQIYHMMKTGENFFEFFDLMKNDTMTLKQAKYYILKEKLYYNFLEITNSLSKSKIRYGVTFSGDTLAKRGYKSFISRNFSMFSSLEKQLMDEKSMVFGKF